MTRSQTTGKIFTRGEAGFEEALFASSFSAEDPGRRPDVIIQASDIADVIAAVQKANRENMRIAVCSGGHSWSQNHIRQGGMLVDLSRLDEMQIDVSSRTAIMGPACLSGDLDAALAPKGLFFPVAHAYTVGLGGFLLQGGFGWNCRMMGMACQSVIAVDVVLADGSLVHASETENAEILWAARGAGPGFFGVVVRFHLRLHDRPKFTGLKIQIFRIRHMEEVFTWADRIGSTVSSKVEFQMVLNRKAMGIFSHGIEIISPVLADSWREAKELTSFIDQNPLRKKASFTLPLIPLSLGKIMRIAEKVVFIPNTRWHTDNMWLENPIDAILPQLRAMADSQPAPPAHALWMNWNPLPEKRPDMAFSLEARSYLALYGGIRGKTLRPQDESWATDHVSAMQHHGAGIQLGDENLARRPAKFLDPTHLSRLEQLTRRYDPGSRFFSYGSLS